MKKLTNKASKELLAKIERQLNYKGEWEIENGCYQYKLELTKGGKIQCNIMDDDYTVYTIEIGKADNVTDILKGFISYFYEEEINHRQVHLKGDKGYFNRKHKSLALWLGKGKQDKVNAIVEDMAKRYKESSRTELEIKHYKGFASRFYSCLNELEPYWKVAEVKDAISAKVQKLGVKNVDISSMQDRIIVAKSDDSTKNVVDKFEMVIGSYVNKNAIANQVITRLNMENIA